MIFDRDLSPLGKLDLGAVSKMAKDTKDAYSFDYYDDKEWRKIIEWLMSMGYDLEIIEVILRSKVMRWANDHKQGDKAVLEDVKKYLEQNPKIIDMLKKEMNENEGGAPAAFTGAGSNPGMGNAQPAGTAAMTGSQQGSSDAIGSGDKFDSSIGPMHTQAKSVTESNINPHDKLGVAMAQKMGIAIPFKKGKGDKDVEQKRVDEDPDLSSEVVTFEDWAKKFVNEGIDIDILRKKSNED